MNIPQVKKPGARLSLTKRLALAFAGASTVAIIGSAGVVAANPVGGQTLTIPNKDACKTQWHHFGFKNQGQCVSYWNKHHHHGNGGGHGYGGGNTTNVTVTVHGDNNVVSVVINYFFS
ncbi:MAG TPA: hypothetical protein VJP80_06620 [Candidatus Saccharimonadales bacterium]|nr:hypothetical protein [Candidatus Saccharimonadales bacterium]